MHGLSVRWSLRGRPAGVAQELRDYVSGTSLARFSGMEGLSYKTWRMREGEWFEGTYVWAESAARDGFAAHMLQTAAEAPGSTIIGSSPELIEAFEVVAVAEGAARFHAGAGPGAGPA